MSNAPHIHYITGTPLNLMLSLQYIMPSDVKQVTSLDLTIQPVQVV